MQIFLVDLHQRLNQNQPEVLPESQLQKQPFLQLPYAEASPSILLIGVRENENTEDLC